MYRDVCSSDRYVVVIGIKVYKVVIGRVYAVEIGSGMYIVVISRMYVVVGW